MNEFTINVIQIIKSIPPGFVMTYGQVAKEAGNNRGARQVSWILSSLSKKHQLPWHRVINAKGEISHTGSEQRELLEMEEVEFNMKGQVDLKEYHWNPEQ